MIKQYAVVIRFRPSETTPRRAVSMCRATLMKDMRSRGMFYVRRSGDGMTYFNPSWDDSTRMRAAFKGVFESERGEHFRTYGMTARGMR